MNALTCPRLRVSALRLAVLPAWLMTTVLSAQQPAAKPEKPAATARHAVVPEKELLITSRDVMDSAEAQYPGPLSFGYVMEQLAGKPRAGAFTHEWLRLWLRDQEVNRDIAPARPGMEAVLEAWRKKDQQGAFDDPLGWSPNIANAPFKLIAIVNRMDLIAPAVVEQIRAARESTAKQLGFLRGNTLALAGPVKNKQFEELGEIFHRTSPELTPARQTGIPAGLDSIFPITTGAGQTKSSPQPEFVAGAGGVGTLIEYYGTTGGEGRLVFALTDTNGQPVEPGFNIILEYQLMAPDRDPALPVPTEPSAVGWANKWHRLGTHAAFDADYLRDLVAVTKGFTDQRKPRNSDEGWRPPPLSQVRTNDGVLDPAAREFREFRPVTGPQPPDPDAPAVLRLRQVPLAQTPAERFHEGKSEQTLAMVLKTRRENFRKEAPVILPTSLLLKGEIEPEGILGARALLTGPPADFTWKVNGLQEKALVRHFSMHTCNGCHGGDTRNENGWHLKGSPNGTLTSAFLALPEDSAARSEIRDRAIILKALLESGERDSDNTLIRLLHRRHRASH